MKTLSASRLVFGAALVAAGGLFMFAGDTNPPAGAVGSTMRTNQEIYDAVLAVGAGGGGGGAACIPALPGAPRGGAVVSCSTLPGTGPSPVISNVYSFSQATTNSANFGGGGSGATSLGELTFTRDADANSFRFFRTCATGTHIPSVTFTFSDGSQNHLEYLLTDVIVSSFAPRMVQRCDGTTIQVEDIKMKCAKMQVKDLIGGGSYEWNSVVAP